MTTPKIPPKKNDRITKKFTNPEIHASIANEIRFFESFGILCILKYWKNQFESDSGSKTRRENELKMWLNLRTLLRGKVNEKRGEPKKVKNDGTSEYCEISLLRCKLSKSNGNSKKKTKKKKPVLVCRHQFKQESSESKEITSDFSGKRKDR